MNLDDMLTDAAVAAMLHIKPRTLVAWRSRGTFAVKFVKVGRTVYYERADVEAWIKAQTKKPSLL